MTEVSDMGYFCQCRSLERSSCAVWVVLETNRVFLMYLEGFFGDFFKCEVAESVGIILVGPWDVVTISEVGFKGFLRCDLYRPRFDWCLFAKQVLSDRKCLQRREPW